MSDEKLITSEDARAYAEALSRQIEMHVGEGATLSDDAVSMMSDLLDWVSAVADVGIEVE